MPEIGQTLAHYKIVEKLGEGGMGVVFKARDTHLDRFVALKVLPAEKVADPDRKRRFVQEAKAASALNHPNIITIYDIDQADGVDFIAMEHVAGKTLDESISRKGMRYPLALEYAIQMADALARAHGAGIVHRDLKPSNVMVDRNGLVKLLDFGLAKLTEVIECDGFAPTETLKQFTEEGTIVGTAAYMSPEQAEGRQVDARSDIFSLGSVLYEMVTGRRAFQGDSTMSTLAAVLHEEPPPLPAGLPRDLAKIITRCLRKDPAWRFQTMADVRVELAELKTESDSGTNVVPEPARRQRLRLVWLIVAGLVLATGALGLLLGTRHPPSKPMKALRATTLPGREWAPALSPDGTQIAFVWGGENGSNDDIWVQLIGEETPRRLTTDPARDHSPAWSPDGLRVAFVRNLKEGAEIRLIPAGGGNERLLAHSSANCSPPLPEQSTVFCGISWSPDGKTLVMVDRDSPGSPNSLFLLDIETRERRRLTNPPAGWAGDGLSGFSPDGRTLAFLRSRARYPCDIYVLPLTTDGVPGAEPRPLTFASTPINGLTWTPDGRGIIFSPWRSQGSSQSLLRIPVSGGAPEPLPTLGSDPGFPSISRNGARLAYATAAVEWHVSRLPLGGLGAGVPARFTASSASEYYPAPSPDGTRVAFVSDRAGSTDIWMADANGADLRRLTALGDRYAHSPKWSPDGQTLAYYARTQDGPFRIFLVSVQGGAPRPLTNRELDEFSPCWSRDGQWVYFHSRSEMAGIEQIWKAPAAGGLAIQVTKNGGARPIESQDGESLYYVTGGGRRIVRTTLDGDKEITVVQKSARTLWALAPGGIYLLDRDAEPKPTIEFFRFADGKRTPLLRLPRGADDYGHSFNSMMAVSPDGRWLYYEERDKVEGDIMLVENFR